MTEGATTSWWRSIAARRGGGPSTMISDDKIIEISFRGSFRG
jgi:hypothetical protein